MTSTVIENVRRAIARGSENLSAPRPGIFPARAALPQDEEIEQFLEEVRKLSGAALRMAPAGAAPALEQLVREQSIRKATLWDTPALRALGLARQLEALGVTLVAPDADKHEMALCDLGITEADYLLPETGTLALRSSALQPRAVSLLPHIHLAVVRPSMLRADLHQVFAAAKDSHYLVFITGPSRTADIELTVTLGVHGPRQLVVWMVEE